MLPLNLQQQQLLYPQKERCCTLRRRMLYPQKERCCNLRRSDVVTSEGEMSQKERCCTLRRRDVVPSEGEMNKCLEVATSNIKICRKNEKEEKI